MVFQNRFVHAQKVVEEKELFRPLVKLEEVTGQSSVLSTLPKVQQRRLY
jgi:hypothetical protein